MVAETRNNHLKENEHYGISSQGTLFLVLKPRQTTPPPYKQNVFIKEEHIYVFINLYLFIYSSWIQRYAQNEWTYLGKGQKGRRNRKQANIVILPKTNLVRTEEGYCECESALLKQHYVGHRQQHSLENICNFIFLEHFCKILTRRQHGKKDAWGKREKICVNSVQALVLSWHSLLFIVLWYFAHVVDILC